MKLFHLSDLHIGKQLNGYSLRESQEQIFQQIIHYAQEEQPDAVLLCGDIYDKSIPSAEAFTVFDRFLTGLSEAAEQAEILVISGNHDSPERLSYASSFLSRHRIHIGALPPQTMDEFLTQVTLTDAYGPVHFYLCPFLKPGYVRHLFEAGVVTDYDSAFHAVLSRETVNSAERNVLLAHQFFTASGVHPETCDSETSVLMAGGLDAIDISALEQFDYAALGHLHGPQKVGEERFRYCGSPGIYSVSEEHHQKAVTVVELRAKGTPLLIRTLPLSAGRRVKRLSGSLEELVEMAADWKEDFVSLTLQEEQEPFDFREQLEEVYHRILEIRIENERTRRKLQEELGELEIPGPLEAFSRFYEAVRHCPMTEKQEQLMREIITEAEEEEER